MRRLSNSQEKRRLHAIALRILSGFLILMLGFPLLVRAEAITTYHTTITVRPDGSLHLKEVIDYDFGDHPRHGIFRDIPLTVKVSRYAPAASVGLSNFTVALEGKPVPFQRSTMRSATDGEMVRYRIGDPAKTVTGRHTYTLSYDVERGVYPSSLSGMEAIRWNAVGAGSNVPVRQAVADLILPPALTRDAVRIGVYTGTYGSTDSRADYRWIDGHHVRFEVDDLAPHEALTVEANYPEGLLGQRADELLPTAADRLMGHWHWGAIVAFLLWLWKHARGFGAKEGVGSVAPQYYPPRGLSLLQSGLILDKFADKKDFAAAILELGTQGYLEVHQPEGDVNPIIRRTDKPAAADDALTPDQRYLLNEILFKNGDTYVVKTRDASRAKAINRQLDTLNEMLYTWSVASGQMHADPQKSRKRFLLTAGAVSAVLIVLAFVSTFKLFGWEVAFLSGMVTLFVGIGASVLFAAVRSRSYSGIFFGLFWLIVSLMGFSGALDGHIFATLFQSPMILLPILIAGVYYFYRRIGIFAPKGLETYRYLLGYREFMKRVERDRIRRFLKQDPNYLDKGLPYAVLFGLDTHWLALYDELSVAQPGWYYGDFHSMDHFNHAVQSETAPPPSESGGFSGGGSFSGGGGGGGGVGSW